MPIFEKCALRVDGTAKHDMHLTTVNDNSQ